MQPYGCISSDIVPPNGNIVNGGDNVMFWRRIKNLREDHDLTQQQVADILNCQREVYRRYEAGERELPLSYAVILARYYNVSIDYIVELTDHRK